MSHRFKVRKNILARAQAPPTKGHCIRDSADWASDRPGALHDDRTEEQPPGGQPDGRMTVLAVAPHPSNPHTSDRQKSICALRQMYFIVIHEHFDVACPG